MSAADVPAGESRLHRIALRFDAETAAVATILLGLFQVVLAPALINPDASLPKFYILPLFSGIIILTGGSFTMASERNPSRQLLQCSVCSNVAGLLMAVIAFCVYCYGLSVVPKEPCVNFASGGHRYRYQKFDCPFDMMVAYSWSVTLQLLLFDSVAALMHGMLSFYAFKALKGE